MSTVTLMPRPLVTLGISLLLMLPTAAAAFDRVQQNSALAPLPRVTSISMNDLYVKFKTLRSEEVIVDTRTAEEYEDGHVPGSLFIPHQSVEAHADSLRRYETVYLYCKSGRRAGIAVTALQKKGLLNLVLVKDSGMPDWLAQGWPVERIMRRDIK